MRFLTVALLTLVSCSGVPQTRDAVAKDPADSPVVDLLRRTPGYGVLWMVEGKFGQQIGHSLPRYAAAVLDLPLEAGVEWSEIDRFLVLVPTANESDRNGFFLLVKGFFDPATVEQRLTSRSFESAGTEAGYKLFEKDVEKGVGIVALANGYLIAGDGALVEEGLALAQGPGKSFLEVKGVKESLKHATASGFMLIGGTAVDPPSMPFYFQFESMVVSVVKFEGDEATYEAVTTYPTEELARRSKTFYDDKIKNGEWGTEVFSSSRRGRTIVLTGRGLLEDLLRGH